MEKQKTENEQVPVEAIVIAHELLEQGTRLIIIAPEMENIPRKVKLIW
jgi:hypothetical protein